MDGAGVAFNHHDASSLQLGVPWSTPRNAHWDQLPRRLPHAYIGSAWYWKTICCASSGDGGVLAFDKPAWRWCDERLGFLGFPETDEEDSKSYAVTAPLYDLFSTHYNNIHMAGTPEGNAADIVIGTLDSPEKANAIAEDKRVIIIGNAV
ncbi:MULTISPECIES: hypothetical protein [Petrimonas]|jgi:hypothetical protein|uniref:hypothetical protein n=1 Tax=Petrimonas mucosa TaxID=1642646 RepID=UPI0023F4E7BC|nr:MULTISPECIES: hypothetical protein [Petrimonas]